MELHSYILPGSREVRATQIRRALQKTARKKSALHLSHFATNLLTYSASYTVPEAQVSKRLEICAIYEANSFCLSHLESSSGIFWIASRLNHSCVPNVENIYNPSTSCVTIHALRKISAGEELTVSYGDSCRNRVQRESDLAFYGFTCDCTACAKTPDSWSGERRRERMYELNQELVLLDRGARTRVHGVKGACYAMSIVEELIDLMVMEGVIGREVGRWYVSLPRLIACQLRYGLGLTRILQLPKSGLLLQCPREDQESYLVARKGTSQQGRDWRRRPSGYSTNAT